MAHQCSSWFWFSTELLPHLEEVPINTPPQKENQTNARAARPLLFGGRRTLAGQFHPGRSNPSAANHHRPAISDGPAASMNGEAGVS